MSLNVNCQYKILERVYYANFDEIVEKIKKGKVLRHDQIKVGKSVWTVAEKVPELAAVFEEAEKLLRIPETVDFKKILTNFQVTESARPPLPELERTDGKKCAIHAEKTPFYICIVCENLFCKDCPPTDNDKQKSCLFCGGKCVLYMGQMWKMAAPKPSAKYELEQDVKATPARNFEIVYTKLRMKDFINALICPLRSPLGLLVGGTLFSALVFGEIVTLFRGGWMLSATVGMAIVMILLKFGVLSKSFENFAQGSYKHRGFMPHLKKFTIWEDFVSPFFIGISSYLLSFGLFIALMTAAITYSWFSFSGNVEAIETEMLQRGEQVNAMINQGKADQRQQMEVKAIINKMRDSQFEAAFGNNHLVDNKEFIKLVYSFVRLSLWFQMPMYFAFILGVLFFPAICLASGENHFQSLKKRFFAGFKMMRTIGFDYLKILFMSFLLLVFSGLAIFGLNRLFSKFEMPVAGIFAAIVTGSFLMFYFWTAFSSILGIALVNKEIVYEQSDENIFS